MLPARVTKLSTTVDSNVKGSWDIVSHGGFIAYYPFLPGSRPGADLAPKRSARPWQITLNGGNNARIVAELTEV